MKQLKITVNGKSYDVQVEEVNAANVTSSAPTATPVAAQATSAPIQQAPVTVVEGEVIAAPMPGNILKVLVSVGSIVKKGDVLLILEAMKMENEICAPEDGTITAVMVNNGETVDSGKPLLTLNKQ